MFSIAELLGLATLCAALIALFLLLRRLGAGDAAVLALLFVSLGLIAGLASIVLA